MYTVSHVLCDDCYVLSQVFSDHTSLSVIIIVLFDTYYYYTTVKIIYMAGWFRVLNTLGTRYFFFTTSVQIDPGSHPAICTLCTRAVLCGSKVARVWH